ncbi:MAG: HlyC/CorC family transporter [Planctomycetes bacterium]|nr:HlyC/CorC family transporter [Planctomycetota bacterium]
MAATSPPPEFLPSLAEALARTLPLLPALCGAGFFATVRIALQRSTPSRLLADLPAARRARLEPLALKADSLATSANLFEVACRAAVPVLVFLALEGIEVGVVARAGLALLLAVPAILFVCEALPAALAARRGDALLQRVLPGFHLLQLPVRLVARGFDALRGALQRAVGLDQNPAATRQIVEGLREVIEDADVVGDLDATEREIIGNVIETRDVSVSTLMTPRTEIFGVEVHDGLVGAARVLAECGHSRIPVYEGSLDTILGMVSARDVVQAAAERRLEKEGLRALVTPALFVPETKSVRELLAEFRREKKKIAIVLDEYGGTAGLVTLGDIVAELVGEVADEAEAGAPLAVRRLPDGSADVDATLHVSEVNEALGTEIPEDAGYETLAGFLLAELGHVPKKGEVVKAAGSEFHVLEASDRRILRVLVQREAAHPARAGAQRSLT